MKSDDVSTLYISQARQLESQAKFKEAERLVHLSIHKWYRYLTLYFQRTVE